MKIALKSVVLILLSLASLLGGFSASAESTVAAGCVLLLNSPEATRIGQWWDTRLYYSHGLLGWNNPRGYTLKPEAKRDVLAYYEGYFTITQISKPQLTKKEFCDHQLSSLKSIVNNRTQLSSTFNSLVLGKGLAGSDCYEILKNACDEDAAAFIPVQRLALQNADEQPPAAKRSAEERNAIRVNKILAELISSEIKYRDSLIALARMRPLLSQIFLTIDQRQKGFSPEDTLGEYLNHLIPTLDLLTEFSSHFLTRFRNQGTLQETLLDLAYLEEYLERSQDVFQNYGRIYQKYNNRQKVFSETRHPFENKLLKKVDDILVTPVQRVPRIMLILRDLKAALPNEASKELDASLAAALKVGDTINKAQGL